MLLESPEWIRVTQQRLTADQPHQKSWTSNPDVATNNQRTGSTSLQRSDRWGTSATSVSCDDIGGTKAADATAGQLVSDRGPQQQKPAGPINRKRSRKQAAPSRNPAAYANLPVVSVILPPELKRMCRGSNNRPGKKLRQSQREQHISDACEMVPHEEADTVTIDLPMLESVACCQTTDQHQLAKNSQVKQPRQPHNPALGRVCQHPGCLKRQQRSSDGRNLYCKAHMKLYGLTAAIKICQYPGCNKQAGKYINVGNNKERNYCYAHLKLHGDKCTHPGCSKLAVRDCVGANVFCILHGKERGVAPSRHCQEEGCVKLALKDSNSNRLYCKSHMRQRGLKPVCKLCKHEGCTKRVVKGSQGEWLYCNRHYKEHGLLSAAWSKYCEHPECSKAAQPSTDGNYRFCLGHMAEHGVRYAYHCKHTGCNRQAVTSATGQRLFCTSHLREHGLTPKKRKLENTNSLPT